MSNSAFTPTVLTIPATGGGGTGQGELSLITNGSAVTDITGWTNVSRVTSNSPLNPLIPTAFSISNAAGAENSTSGGYASFTLPTGLQNRKLKVEFYYTTPATDVYRVSVYKGSTRVPLSTDSSNVTTLPANTTGKFTAYFDTDTSASWSLNVTRTSGTTGPCYITNVVVGPGIQPQGAVVGEAVSYTPTWTNLTLGNGTTSGLYRRVGSFMEVEATLTWGTTTSLSGTLGIDLPSTAFNLGSIPGVGQAVGTARIRDAGVMTYTGVVTVNVTSGSANIASIALYNNNSAVSNTVPFTFGSADTVSINFMVPIAEWAGSGTVQLAQNDVEYVSNTSSWDSNTNSTTAFAYGPSGQLIPASTDLTDLRKKRVRFQSPIQPGDQILVELQINGTWVPAIGSAGAGDWNLDGFSYTTSSASTATKGIGWQPVPGTSTDIDVYFGRYATFYNNVTTIGWTSFVSSNVVRWRVRKSSAGAAVGFGLYQPGVSAGLVSSSGLAGRADGNPIASGYVGEVLGTTNAGTGGNLYTTTSSASLTTTLASVASISLNKGVYLCTFGGYVNKAINANPDRASGLFYIGGTSITNSEFSSTGTNVSGTMLAVSATYPVVVTTDSTTVAIFMKTATDASAAAGTWRLSVIRIA